MKPTRLFKVRKIESLVRLLEFAKAFWSKGNDIALGIRTMPYGFKVTSLASDELHERNGNSIKSLIPDSSGYESPDYANLRKIISFVDPKPHDVVFDLGSGMGRVLCLFARHKVNRCVGIELFPTLCASAETNAQNLRGRVSPIEIRQGDVADADYSNGTIFFLFNPFGADTLRIVLERIKDTLKDSNREVTFIYYKDLHVDVFESCPWIEQFHEIITLSRINVSFWRARPNVCAFKESTK